MEIIKLTENIVTSNTEEFKSAFEKLFSKSIYDIVVDFSEIRLICSSGLGVLLSAFKKTKNSGGDIKIIIPESNREISQIFDITRLNTIFKVYRNIDEIK